MNREHFAPYRLRHALEFFDNEETMSGKKYIWQCDDCENARESGYFFTHRYTNLIKQMLC